MAERQISQRQHDAQERYLAREEQKSRTHDRRVRANAAELYAACRDVAKARTRWQTINAEQRCTAIINKIDQND